MEVRAELKYTKSHEWVKEEGGVWTIGLTDYAQHLPHCIFCSYQFHFLFLTLYGLWHKNTCRHCGRYSAQTFLYSTIKRMDK